MFFIDFVGLLLMGILLMWRRLLINFFIFFFLLEFFIREEGNLVFKEVVRVIKVFVRVISFIKFLNGK